MSIVHHVSVLYISAFEFLCGGSALCDRIIISGHSRHSGASRCVSRGISNYNKYQDKHDRPRVRIQDGNTLSIAQIANSKPEVMKLLLLHLCHLSHDQMQGNILLPPA